MERADFLELVEYLEPRFGTGAMGAWRAIEKIYPDFAELDSETVWESLLAKLDSDPKAQFPPTPPALRAAALDRARHKPRPALPESTGPGEPWAAYSERHYGEVVSLYEAARRAHNDRVAEGKAFCRHPGCLVEVDGVMVHQTNERERARA